MRHYRHRLRITTLIMVLLGMADICRAVSRYRCLAWELANDDVR
jgi:hypothetical protein